MSDHKIVITDINIKVKRKKSVKFFPAFLNAICFWIIGKNSILFINVLVDYIHIGFLV
jgi:hypothetical protein